MRHAHKNAATNEEPKPSLVPKLRFPEFEGEWEERRLGECGELLSSLTGKAGADFDVGSARFITYMNVFANIFADASAFRQVNVGDDEKQNKVARGDVFFTISSETPDEVGMSSVLLADIENCYLNSFCALFRFHTIGRPNSLFTGYLLRQPTVRNYFAKKAQGSTRFNLSKDAFRLLPLFIPSLPEQQRIASCLSSLDELIGAQARKVDALKTHKKGLMQQLFPREGETQPRLRFPEFQNAREWQTTTIGDLKPFVTSGSRGWAPFYAEQGVLFVRITNLWRDSIFLDLTDCKFVQLPPGANEGVRTQLKEHDVLISITADIGIIGYVDESVPSPAYINQHIALVRFDEGQLCGKFVAYFLASEESQRRFRASMDTGTKAGMSLIGIQKIGLILPSLPEQQRIASCLSSLDELITAHAQKVEALKTHKKGLMQGLFPKVDSLGE